MYTNYPFGVCLAHNGNLTNVKELKEKVFVEARHINTDSVSSSVAVLVPNHIPFVRARIVVPAVMPTFQLVVVFAVVADVFQVGSSPENVAEGQAACHTCTVGQKKQKREHTQRGGLGRVSALGARRSRDKRRKDKEHKIVVLPRWCSLANGDTPHALTLFIGVFLE